MTTESAPPPSAPAKPLSKVGLIISVLLLGCCGLFAISSMLGGGDNDQPDTVADAPTDDQPVPEATTAEKAAPAEDTEEPTEESTKEPEATATDEPTDVPPEPIHLEGSGQTATDLVNVPFPVAVASFTHNGQRNFIVTVFPEAGGETLLVNTIGGYTGQVFLSDTGNLTFDIDADGAWTADIAPVTVAEGAAFSGRGDAVSGIFDPPDGGPWEFTHDGGRNFIVTLACAGGDDLVQNEIGPVSASGIVRFDEGPCLWVVQADGNWSLAPRK